MNDFSHPQYFTASGATRAKRNPNSKLRLEAARKRVRAVAKAKRDALIAKVSERNGRVATLSTGSKRKGISPKAAKMIAEALKGMLNS
jgi:hypothetical protein